MKYAQCVLTARFMFELVFALAKMGQVILRVLSLTNPTFDYHMDIE